MSGAYDRVDISMQRIVDSKEYLIGGNFMMQLLAVWFACLPGAPPSSSSSAAAIICGIRHSSTNNVGNDGNDGSDDSSTAMSSINGAHAAACCWLKNC